MFSKLARRTTLAAFARANRHQEKRLSSTFSAKKCAIAASFSLVVNASASVAHAAPNEHSTTHKGAKPVGSTPRSTKRAESEPNYVPPTMEYDEIIDPSKRRTISSLLSSEFALRAERVDRAIQLARRAMQRDPDDMDVHKALAEALDRKLETQAEKDPRLFGECVREWLIVMRNGVGMEKGTNFRGMGVVDHFFGDDEYYVVAKKRLKHLTGYVPKPWESNEKYLKKVLQPAQTSIEGRIIKKSD
ncbi:MAG TPA: tetratricopeptide repeat protein [Candidatus Melainabacteria bacterium]|jgi:hypothetical protein|nr:tetratricopeptide repeat protein [Candidatus Melainabacteria bacterium]